MTNNKNLLSALLASLLLLCSSMSFATTQSLGYDFAQNKLGRNLFNGEIKISDGIKVIYGDDNRVDYYQVQDSNWLRKIDSTVVLIQSSKLTEFDSNHYRAESKPFSEWLSPMCETERFGNQPVAGFCSGSLVAPDIIMTAGHCIRSDLSAKNTSYVFDFHLSSENADATLIKKENVYRGVSLITSFVANNGADYALIRLERPVTNREPLALNRAERTRANDKVVVIGHPTGLPVKYSPEAKVRGHRSGYFVASLDTYGGNSGSAVLNQATGLVEGILVRGETDFEWANGCRRSKVCQEDECRGEDVTQISEVIPHLDSAVNL